MKSIPDGEAVKLLNTKYEYPRSLFIIKKWGFPVTLEGTNNKKWIAYFPKGDFTIVTNKKTDVINMVLPGKQGREAI